MTGRLVVCFGPPAIKYRFSYPTACESQVQHQIAELLRVLPWAAAG
jgi:hypothetical protein